MSRLDRLERSARDLIVTSPEEKKGKYREVRRLLLEAIEVLLS